VSLKKFESADATMEERRREARGERETMDDFLLDSRVVP
jgi:hypothetical protein